MVVLDWWSEFWASVGTFFMEKDEQGMNYLTRILIAIAIIIVGYIIIKILTILLKRLMKIKKKGPDIDKSAKSVIVAVIKIFLWIAVSFLVISILKIDVSGVAGVTSAVTVGLSLALQDLIGCFASGVLILQQKYIVTGDYISIQNGYGQCEGTVISINVFFTHLRTPNGQIVTVPNNSVQKAIVTNYTRLGKRRLNYDVGVAYDSDIALTKKVLLEMLQDDQRRLKDEELSVYVYELGAYSVGIRIRCWTSTDTYWPLYNDLSEMVLLKFRENGIYIPSSTDRAVIK